MSLLALALVLGVDARAQGNATPNVQRFQPTGSAQGFASTLSARQLGKGAFGVDGLLQYAHRPYQLSTIQDGALVRAEGAVDGLFAVHLRAAYGLHDRVELSLDAPFLQVAQTDVGIEEFGEGQQGSLGLGDVNVQAQIRAVDEDALGVAIQPFVTLPTGTRKILLGNGVPTLGARLAVSKSLAPVHVAANVGYRFMPSYTYVGEAVAVDDELLYAGGLGFDMVPERVRLNVELGGAIVVGPSRGLVTQDVIKGSLHSPMELLVDVRADTPSGVSVLFGGGPGLTPAVGTPVFRAFVGLGWRPPEALDTDGDGLLDKVDQCPEDPEDFDQFQDQDGCPEFDNDGDGIADMVDRCPNDPEDFDGFEDPDGCPDPDNDQDRILDVSDACPLQPEDWDGVEDQDGCPDTEVPVVDSDRDGKLDPVDLCPFEPEDYDGFQDEDGCPDPDNDNDGIPDVRDLCPLEPENMNGIKDDDGCPDAQRVIVTRDRIIITEKVLFYTAEARIVESSYPLLEEVLQTLLDNPQILLVKIEGHTDSRGSEKYNLDLSDRRAKAIRDFLVERGIAPDRLEAEGFGEMSPLVENDTPENMEQNRRVEFIILKQE